MSRSIPRCRSAYTLIETLMAMLMVSAVAAVVFGSYITLEKGFTFMTTWSDARNCMIRVLDAIEIDLRNATNVTITPGTPIQTLTLSIPQAYTSYSSADVRAGEASSGLVSGTLDSNGNVKYTGTMTVVYSGTASGASGQIIQRKATWLLSGTGATLSATRKVATFSNGANLSYVVLTSSTDGSFSPTISSTTSTNVSSTFLISSSNCTTYRAVCILLSATTNDLRRPLATGTMQDTVNLRACSIQ